MSAVVLESQDTSQFEYETLRGGELGALPRMLWLYESVPSNG
jgi:hypothetical protein